MSVVLAFLVVAIIDARLKSSAMAGYVPADARWVVLCDDFGKFWFELEKTDVYARLRAESYFPIEERVLAVRKAQGIRPTPARWRTWMGRRAVAAETPDGIGFSVRPGVLLRFGEFAYRVTHRDRGSILRRWGDYSYGWREGFLVFSKSPQYVIDALDGMNMAVDSTSPSEVLRVLWNREPKSVLKFHPADGLPVEGWLGRTLPTRDTPLTLVESWPEPPLLSISGSSVRDLSELANEIIGALPSTELVRYWIDEVAERMPEGWDGDGREFALAIADIDTSHFMALPEVALVIRGSSIIDPPEDTSGLLPHEWNAERGWIRPWMGERLLFCFGEQGDDYYVTSQERLMARYFGRLHAREPVDADVVFTLDWSQFTEVAVTLLERAAAYELIPRMGLSDVRSSVLPYVLLAGELGNVYVEGFASEDRISLEGFLALDVAERDGGAI